MYSMVLMMALTGGADTVGCHHRGGDYGGCYGGCYGDVFGAGCSGWLASSGYGCNGYGYGCSGGWGSGHGCWGSGHGCSGSSYGCSGGGHHGRRGGLFGGRHRGHGCSGSGYGCSGYGYGCSGYGYGCSGYGYGCNGYGCSGMMACGCAPVMVGCTGVPAAPPPATNGDTGETGNMKKKEEGEKIGEPKEEEKKGVQNTPAPGTIIVNLPAGARLTVDGVPTRSTESVRAFATPVLQPGRSYHYTLRAEITRNGQTVQTERLVPVSAGQTSRVMLDFTATTQRVASR